MDNNGRNEIALATKIEKVMEDFQTRTLDSLEGLFSRLIYISSLRDHNTGRYYHSGLEGLYGSEATDEGLRQCHNQVFENLVSLPLKAQTDDLVTFFQSLKEERTRLVDAWERLRAYQILPPEHCSSLARHLFEKNVEIILKVLRETELWELLHDPHGDTDDLA